MSDSKYISTEIIDSLEYDDLDNKSTHSLVNDSEFVFWAEDTLKVILKPLKEKKNISFEVNINGENLKGEANLVLIEDNGQFILPESTPILDERDGSEFPIDSTYTFDSSNFSLVFAMEKNSKSKLSFTINNSTNNNIPDGFYVLSRK
ncbi:MAG: hypothetical protein CMP77_09570 [Flavobacterium sp.]|nr:hypothetical protein [Flavobacterium sp.]